MNIIVVLLVIFLNRAAFSSEDISEEDWSFHFQSTLVSQGHWGFNALYSGKNSLISSEEIRTSFTSTLYLGRRLWQGGALYLDPELSSGSGLSQTLGVAGYPNGEIYRVDSPGATIHISRIYLQQSFNLSGGIQPVEALRNQLGGQENLNRLTFVFGKFSLNDFFDDNTYSHDPRTQFLNWAFMDNGAWDYAADTRGYTWGVYSELVYSWWSARGALVLEPDQANQLGLDMNIPHAYSENLELEGRYTILSHPGKTKALLYDNHAFMGNYRQALAASPSAPDVTSTRSYSVKYGFGLNFEQEILTDLGFFSRIGWNDGATETWAFTEVDSTFSLGLSLKGVRWKRPDDVMGLGYISNGLSADHTAYLTAGGYGFLIGDGFLNYAREQILEAYYLFKPFPQLGLTADFQFVGNPAYNQDRGPVQIFAGRAHYEF